MNKFTKASIATGAGIVLLLGGAGTFAYWNDSADLADATINSGVLTVEADGTGFWTEDGTTALPSSFLIVPGDVITYTGDFDVNASGDNLKATLSVDTSSIAGSSVLADTLVYSVALNGATPGTLSDNGDGTWEITPGTTGVTDLSVTVTVTFPSSTSGTVAQDQSVDLSDLTLVVRQHA